MDSSDIDHLSPEQAAEEGGDIHYQAEKDDLKMDDLL